MRVPVGDLFNLYCIFLSYLWWVTQTVPESIFPDQIKELVYPKKVSREYMRSFLLQLETFSNSTNTMNRNVSEKNIQDNDDNTENSDLYYIIQTTWSNFLIKLELSNSFLSPSFQIEERFGDLFQEGVKKDNIEKCFYSGIMLNKPQSHVVINICGGLNGIIADATADYFIEPSKSGNQLEHIIYSANNKKENSELTRTKNLTSCGINDIVKDQPKKLFHGYKFSIEEGGEVRLTSLNIRKRRSSSLRRYVELMVVADESMFEFYDRKEIELRRYVLSVMAIVTSILKDSTIGNFIDISVVKLLILKKNPPGFQTSKFASKTLRRFCKWQRSQNKPTDDDPEHFDAAVLITRRDLCSTPPQCDTLGLAELGSVCDPQRSCAVVEDNGLSSAFTIAHEIGHLLNAPHDGDDNECTEDKDNVHVMTPSFSIKSKIWTWSSCSRKYITEFLDSSDASCLLDKPSPKFEHPLPLKLPGEMFSMTEQCKLVYGENAMICPYAKYCDRLLCAVSRKNKTGCRINNMPWADGTFCAEKSWCRQGKCVKKEKLVPIHGGWGNWSSFGDCSRPCGGGVRYAVRECNNPKPANGGHYCIGDRYKYESCNYQLCKGLKKSFRTSQCEAFNGKNLGIPGVPSSVQWVPKSSGVKKKDLCKLLCEIKGYGLFYDLASKVIDGTKCKKGSNDICVNGRCMSAGCDNKLGSKSRRDNCGKCNGDNSSCRRYEGYQNETSLGYNSVVHVPQGASRLKVVKTSKTPGKYAAHFLDFKEKAELFNNFFVNQCSLLRDSSVLPTDLPQLTNKCLGSIHFSSSDIAKIISHLDPNKAHGHDMLSIWMIKLCGNSICKPLSIIFNDCLNEALLNQQKKYVFNGQWRVSLGSSKYNTYGTTIYYSGPNVKNETIWIPGTLLTSVEIKVLSITKTMQCEIWYSYNYPVLGNQSYVWALQNEWSGCFPVCQGHQVKEYECQREIDSQKVDASKCHGERPQASIKKCNQHCKLRWEVYKSECVPIDVCGKGIQEQKVSCMVVSDQNSHEDNKTLNIKDCEKAQIGKIPPPEIPCYVPCTSVRWVYSKWDECNASCGGGTQTRTIECINQATMKPVSLSKCSSTQLGPLKRSCNLNICPKWHSDAWSGACSVTCGSGYVERSVYCYIDGKPVEDKFCNSEVKPDRTRPCLMSSCARWKSRAWSKCSKPCGTGYEIREVHCETEVGEKVSESKCVASEKPAERKKCFKRACVVKAGIVPRNTENSNALVNIRWLTGLWSECSKSCGNGVRKRVVACVENNIIVSDSKCDLALKPYHMESCSVFPCPFWRYGQWSECTKQCGKGTQTRLVLCGFNGTIVSDKYCDERKKPVERRFCNEEKCQSIGDASKSDKDEPDRNWEFSKWSECSASCGIGTKRRQVTCAGYRCREDVKPVEIMSCDRGACPGWNYGQWAPCQTKNGCGIGWQARLVVCQMDDGRVIKDSKCDKQYKPANNRTCELEPCQLEASWITTLWQPCNVPCGDGLQFRYISCEDIHGKNLPDARCLAYESKPPQQKACSRSPCPKWHTTAWQRCDSTCTQRRDVICKRGEELVDDTLCNLEVRPYAEQPCSHENCVNNVVYTWKVGEWSECARTCGYSLRSRDLHCMKDNNANVNASFCNQHKPTTVEQCFAGPCPPEWIYEPWSECSVKCGKGIQSRNAYCQNPDGKTITDSSCDINLKEIVSRECYRGPCGEIFHWKTDEWSECSLTCGVGEKKRDVTCVNDRDEPQINAKCDSRLRPGNMVVCNINACPLRSCRDVKENFAVNFDGEQELLFGKSIITVYCEGMQRTNPKEFITLKADPEENYSEIYDKRLRKWNVCPNAGNRQNTCKNCIDYTASGITYFKKIRIDVRRMVIVPEDKTFADQFGRNPPSYASAGDCYSSAKCPQGRFRVNLVGTGLRISSGVTWQSRGYHTSQKIKRHYKNQIIYGTCGGYCGMCSPSYGTGLRVTSINESQR